MKSSQIATLGAVFLLATGLALPSLAEGEMSTADEVAQFQGSKMTLAEAITAAEKAAGGVAMEASWESSASGGYEVVVVMPDATRMLATVAADGTVTSKALMDDEDEKGDDGDGDGEDND